MHPPPRPVSCTDLHPHAGVRENALRPELKRFRGNLWQNWGHGYGFSALPAAALVRFGPARLHLPTSINTGHADSRLRGQAHLGLRLPRNGSCCSWRYGKQCRQDPRGKCGSSRPSGRSCNNSSTGGSSGIRTWRVSRRRLSLAAQVPPTRYFSVPCATFSGQSPARADRHKCRRGLEPRPTGIEPRANSASRSNHEVTNGRFDTRHGAASGIGRHIRVIDAP